MYVRLTEGFVYLACILDVYSRNCIGWSLSRRIGTQLPLQALEMALAQRDCLRRVDSSLQSGKIVL
jgi:putative transposase